MGSIAKSIAGLRGHEGAVVGVAFLLVVAAKVLAQAAGLGPDQLREAATVAVSVLAACGLVAANNAAKRS